MSQQNSRYHSTESITVAEGWQVERLTPPSRLFGANGLRTGADGKLYVAQVAGSQVSAIDIETGGIETVSPLGGDIIAPDDLAFDDAGNLYATEITEGRVSMRRPNGEYRIVNGDMPCANPITVHRGHLYAGECRPGGRIMELDLDGGAPRVILDNVPMPNAMEVGPDGKLYFPVMATSEIWRVDPAGGEPEVVTTGLGVPDAVKFDPDGFLVSTQAATGQVIRVDPRTGDKTVLADVAPGLDNLSFVGERLFVSNITGQITEILAPGEVRPLVDNGLQWPLDVAVGSEGELLVVDGGFVFTLPPGGELQLVGFLFSPGFPGYSRGAVAAGPGEWVVTTANGDLARFWPAEQRSEVLAGGLDQLMGVDLAADGSPVFAEYGTGRLLGLDGGSVATLASGLDMPKGVAVLPGGDILVAEAGAGRVARVAGGHRDVFIDGLGRPEGIAVSDGVVYVLDIGTKQLLAMNTDGGNCRVIASGLPVGVPAGVVFRPLGGVGDLSGPMGNFTGIAAGADGTLFIAADAEGSVLAISTG